MGGLPILTFLPVHISLATKNAPRNITLVPHPLTLLATTSSARKRLSVFKKGKSKQANKRMNRQIKQIKKKIKRRQRAKRVQSLSPRELLKYLCEKTNKQTNKNEGENNLKRYVIPSAVACHQDSGWDSFLKQNCELALCSPNIKRFRR